MAANVYNVIWADDEIDSLRRDKSVVSVMESQNVKLLDFAHTSSELKEILTEKEDMVDAVITDGNFDKKRTINFNDRSTSGISDVLTFISEFNRKRIIPFFLYSGKKKLLKEKFTDGELDYFEQRGRIFEKGNLDKMLIKIKEEVDYVNSAQFRIRNKYAKEFEAAKLIEGATENLKRGLLYLYEDSSWKSTQDYFNPARKIFERMKGKCEEMNILPPGTSLNNASRYFSGIDKYIGLIVDFMPKPLAESLFYFLKITQDGSHDDNDMSLGVDQYVRKNENINLYRSILYISMDLLLWFEKINKQYANNKQPLWKDKFIYEGKVCSNPYGGGFTSGIYELQKSKELKDGLTVRIYGSEPHKYQKGLITEYVTADNYRIVH